MKQKTRKSYSKRFVVTKKKKVLKRSCGQAHFNARESGNVTRNKRRDTGIHSGWQKLIREETNN
jgi:ribosomal protein L35